MMPFDPVAIALVALLALLVTGALAPLETLGWWAGWYGDPVDERRLDPLDGHPEEADAPEPGAPQATTAATATRGPWVVYLSGIHAVGPIIRAGGCSRSSPTR